MEHFHPNIWPAANMGLDLQPAMIAYYRAMAGLSRLLLQLCALALVCLQACINVSVLATMACAVVV